MTALTRPMFRPRIVRRQTGTPITGEEKDILRSEFGATKNDIKNLSSLTPDAKNVLSDALSMRNFGVFKEKPELDSYGKTVIDPEFQNFLLSTYGERGQSILDTLLQGNNPDNFSLLTGLINEFTNFKISNEMKEKGALPSRDDILSEEEMNYLNRLKNRAEGSPMEGEKSDAVGIADGLDQEMPKADPNTTGVAKVSPEQYVELMNQVRGDEVPLEGRVQELASTVGEKDAQDTPLSVLALVQPVFELQEQQGGLAAAPGAQQMMQQQNPMMMAKDGGIVQRFNGSGQMGENAQNLFSALGESNIFNSQALPVLESLADVYNVRAEPFDTSAVRQQYEQQLINKEGLRDDAFLAAAPEFLQLGAAALTPGASISDILTQAATGVARFGTSQGKKIQNLKNKALKLALADKDADTKTKQAFIGAITGPLLEDVLKTQKESDLEDVTLETKVAELAGIKTKNLLDELEVTFKNVELGYADENQMLDLQAKRAELDKNLILLNSLEDREGAEIQKIITDTNLAIAQIDGAELSNQAQSITNEFIRDKENADLQNKILTNTGLNLNNLSTQLDLDAKPEMIKAQLEKITLENEKLFGEVDMMDEFNAQKYKENELKIQDLESKLDGSLVDPETIRVRDSFTKNFKSESVLKDAAKLTFHYDSLSQAILQGDLTAERVLELTGGGDAKDKAAIEKLIRKNPSGASDLVIMFNFMKMLDPDSVVREGEQIILTKQANPLARRFNAYIKEITGEGFLSSAGRAEILTETQKIMQNSYEKVLETKGAYTEIGKINFPDLYKKGQLDTFLPVTGFETYLEDVRNNVYGSDYPDWMNSI